MIDIDDSPHRDQLMSVITQALDGIRARHDGVTESYARDVRMMLNDWRRWCARQGVSFPQMAVMPLLSANTLAVVRRDLDRRSLEVALCNLLTAHPMLDPRELATVAKREFPGYSPI